VLIHGIRIFLLQLLPVAFFQSLCEASDKREFGIDSRLDGLGTGFLNRLSLKGLQHHVVVATRRLHLG
jgi:hypothetical protein